MKKILYVLLLILAFSVCYSAAINCESFKKADTITIEKIIHTTDTITYHDTIVHYKPKYVDRIVLEEIYVKDTTIVREQVQYCDTDYMAYVSGVMPVLDSIKVYPKTTLIRDSVVVIRDNYIKKKPSPIDFGLNVGYGVTPKGLQPYIGIGVRIKL